MILKNLLISLVMKIRKLLRALLKKLNNGKRVILKLQRKNMKRSKKNLKRLLILFLRKHKLRLGLENRKEM